MATKKKATKKKASATKPVAKKKASSKKTSAKKKTSFKKKTFATKPVAKKKASSKKTSAKKETSLKKKTFATKPVAKKKVSFAKSPSGEVASPKSKKEPSLGAKTKPQQPALSDTNNLEKKLTAKEKVTKKQLLVNQKRFESLQETFKDAKVLNYDMKKSYHAQTPINHPQFGWGVIQSIRNDRMEVLFKDGSKKTHLQL